MSGSDEAAVYDSSCYTNASVCCLQVNTVGLFWRKAAFELPRRHAVVAAAASSGGSRGVSAGGDAVKDGAAALVHAPASSRGIRGI